tara:strand:+ start:306 stop:464 length:159 start_codon:yes stop_codon:yes gene_type:complete
MPYTVMKKAKKQMKDLKKSIGKKNYGGGKMTAVAKKAGKDKYVTPKMKGMKA